MADRTLSDVIAERVIQLRKEAGLTREEFVARCQEVAGSASGDFSVGAMANIETGRRTKDGVRRRKIDADEVAVFAAVLKVPPVWLMTDARSLEPTPLYGDVEVNPWVALGWMTGTWPLRESSWSDGWSDDGFAPLYHLTTYARLLEQYVLLKRALNPAVPVHRVGEMSSASMTIFSDEDPDEARRSFERGCEHTVRVIAQELESFINLQLPIPPVPPDVRQHAAELGIDLPR